MKILILILFLAIVGRTYSISKEYVEVPELAVLNGTTYFISAFSPKIVIRSNEFALNSTKCLHFSFRFLERRVKLRAYTCLLGEGGFCVMDKFSFPDDKEGCTYLRPWSKEVAEFLFHFELEKRQRKYGKHFYQRQRKLKRQTTPKKEMSTKPIGFLSLYGVVDCTEVCAGKNFSSLGSQGDATYYRGRPSRFNLSRK